jgi:hypothetical protein
VSYRAIFPGLFDIKKFPPTIAHIIFSQRNQRYLWTLGGNHIVWNLEHIRSKQFPSSLYWFHGGATVFGVGMTALAVVMCAAAVALASLSDRIEQQSVAKRAGALLGGAA